MSLEIVLIPLAFAAVSGWKAARGSNTSEREAIAAGQQAGLVRDTQGRTGLQVSSRMRDAGLLAQALQDAGAAVSASGDTLTAQWADVQAEFTRDDEGVWSAQLTGDVDEQRAVGIITAVDDAYGRRVQQALLETLRARAELAGMTIERETVEADESVTVTLAVGTA